MEKLFGTDGIRGIANSRFTEEFSYLIGKYGADVLSNNSRNTRKIIVGMDTRESSPIIEKNVCMGISSCGIDVIRLSYVPTPAISHLIRKYNLLGGVMISASHNPYEYNGIKFFDHNGIKLCDELEEKIEKLYYDNNMLENDKTNNEGKVEYSEYMVNEYEEFLLSFLNIDLTGLKIAIDCANGAASFIGQDVFNKTGAEVLTINNNPNGVNINNNCGSTSMDNISKFVVENNCDFGFAYDGDADRCLAVDHEGNVVNGDYIMGIIAIYFKERGILAGNNVVTTVMSNMGLYKSLENYGINTSKVSVGDKYVFQDMDKNKYVLGGEQSGHIILFDNKTGDGILTSLMLSKIIKEKKTTLKKLSSLIEEFPQVLINVPVTSGNKKIYKEDEDVVNLIKKYEDELSDYGRILVRESGTENLIRIMVEGKNKDKIESISNDIKELIKNKLIQRA